jgi:DNA polymerase III subunit delta
VILQTLSELEDALRAADLQSVYLVLGEEQYQCRQAVNLLKLKALHAAYSAFDCSEFSAGHACVSEMLEAANTFPMLSKKRVVLISDAEKLTDTEQDELAGKLGELSPRSMLILLAEDLDHRKKLYRTVREKGCVAEFSRLKGAALERWVENFARKLGFQISPPAVKKILDLVGPDLQNLSTELEKLAIYAGRQKSISDSAIDDLVRSSRQHRVFDMIDALGMRDRAGALRLLSNLLAEGEHPIMIVAMMARHCRQMLITRECLDRGIPAREVTAKIQIPPFLWDKFLRQARSADPAATAEIYKRLADIDRRLKSSSGDGRLLLEQVLFSLI